MLEHPAEAFPAVDDPIGRRFLHWLDEAIVDDLVFAFGVVVLKVLSNGAPQGVLAKEDHPVETLFLDATHEAFYVRVQVRLLLLTAVDSGVGVVDLVDFNILKAKFGEQLVAPDDLAAAVAIDAALSDADEE